MQGFQILLAKKVLPDIPTARLLLTPRPEEEFRPGCSKGTSFKIYSGQIILITIYIHTHYGNLL